MWRELITRIKLAESVKVRRDQQLVGAPTQSSRATTKSRKLKPRVVREWAQALKFKIRTERWQHTLVNCTKASQVTAIYYLPTQFFIQKVIGRRSLKIQHKSLVCVFHNHAGLACVMVHALSARLGRPGSRHWHGYCKFFNQHHHKAFCSAHIKKQISIWNTFESGPRTEI